MKSGSAGAISVLLMLIGATLPAGAQGLVLLDDARFVGQSVRLTTANPWRRGAAWFVGKQSMAQGFTAVFQFRITNPGGDVDSNGETGADGLAFVIQNFDQNDVGDGGFGIGYNRIDNSLAVEFDTWYNPELGDPNGNHVSVHTRGTGENDASESASIGRTTAIPNLSNGAIHTAAVDYRPAGGGVLSVAVDGRIVLTLRVNLSQILSLDNGRAYVGWTSGTGAAFENHDLVGWAFRPL